MSHRSVQMRRSAFTTSTPSAPNDLAVTIDTVKEECGFPTSDTDQDSLFRSLIIQAQNYVEEAAREFVRPVTVTEKIDAFPEGKIPIRLSRPCRSLTSVVYVDENGATQTVLASNYSTWLTHTPPLISAKGSTPWPTTSSDELAAVTITYESGPASVSAAKPALLQAVILICKETWQKGDRNDLAIPPQAKDMIAIVSGRGAN